MSDPEVPQPERPTDVNDVVDSAKAGLDAAAAAGADVPAEARDSTNEATTDASGAPDAVDPDLAAFEEAERDHPGTFAGANDEAVVMDGAPADSASARTFLTDEPTDADIDAANVAVAAAAAESIDERSGLVADQPTSVTSVYDAAERDDTLVIPSEPVVAAAPPAAMQPIFVQAPEPPRDRGNRGTAGLIGLLATVAFAILFLGAGLALGAINGDVDSDNLGDAAVEPLTQWGFWTPVVVFFLSFWLLGAIINRGRWGRWVIFGLLVGVASYFGYILGQLFEAPFWMITASEGTELVEGQVFAPLAIAAFVIGRELTIWFGAWVARSGARKTELNAEAQREYERTLEAGPTLPR